MSELNDIIERAISEDEGFDTKDVGDTFPEFDIQSFGSAGYDFIYVVKVNGEFIGSLENRVGGDEARRGDWHIVYLPKRKARTYVPVTNAHEGAQKLWLEWSGKIELPEVEKPYEPLVPPPDDPDHYESIRQKAANLVSLVVEDDDVEVAEKTHEPDEVDHAMAALTEAGFRVDRHDGSEKFLVTVSWPAANASALNSGALRAKQIIESMLPMPVSKRLVKNGDKASLIVTNT